MASRFVFQKFASGMMLRLTSRLSAHAPASSRATTPDDSIDGTKCCDLRVVTLGGNVVSKGARYLSTFPGSREAAKTGWSKTGMQDSVGVKPTCSSGACDKLQLADWLASVKTWWAHKKPTSLDQQDMNVLLFIVLAAVCFVRLPSEVKSSHKAPIRHGSGCCYCLSGRSESGVQDCKLP